MPAKYQFNDHENIIVEFSSPNIAKPFHVGHLRSTIIGNFLSNLLRFHRHNVTRLNFCGDWGTQLGFLTVGVDLKNYSEEEMKENPIQNLYHAYIEANRLSEHDPSISERARAIFQQMECGDYEGMEKWTQYRKYTVEELQRVYKRLGVEFDEYNWESMYSRREIQSVIDLLRTKEMLSKDENGRAVIALENKTVPVIKSDGTTLYLTRDLAALMDRCQRFDFQRMFYVVDNSQAQHFNSLFEITRRMLPEWSNRSLVHIKFGRIRGMSTRKGTCVFLKDILDEARDIMKQKQTESPTTKIDVVNMEERTADVLGISAVIVNDLKQRRQRDYEFDWDRVLQTNGDTGIKMQYTHCRLSSLMEKQGSQIAHLTDEDIKLYTLSPKVSGDPDAKHLMNVIDQFGATIQQTTATLEACVLVSYLFALCNASSKALKRVSVKNEACDELRREKLILFKKAQLVLRQGMEILGLQPLDRM